MPIRSIIKNCPNCGKVVEQRPVNARGKVATDEEKWLFGTPLRMCPHCKKLFIDKDIQELAATGLRRQDRALINAPTLKLSLMGIILGVLMFVAGLKVFAIVAAAVGVLCAVADVCMYPMRMKKLENERRASEKRLSDPAYARMLKNAGYNIPDQYLTDEHKEEAAS